MNCNEENKKQWLVNTNEEVWCHGDDIFESKEEAICKGAEFLGLEKGDGFYVGVKNKYYFLTRLTARDFLEREFEEDFERLGEWSDCWQGNLLECKDFEVFFKSKMQEIADYVNANHVATFFTVDEIEAVE